LCCTEIETDSKNGLHILWPSFTDGKRIMDLFSKLAKQSWTKKEWNNVQTDGQCWLQVQNCCMPVSKLIALI
jgi:hypothetical protein